MRFQSKWRGKNIQQQPFFLEINKKAAMTVEDARKSMKLSYAVKRDEKKTKNGVLKQCSKWSKPDYKNETTEEEKVGLHKKTFC